MKKISLLILLIILITGCSGTGETDSETQIIWDNYGVPHIYGKNTREMYYAFGWSQMHNHANLMLKLYGQARGCAAEYWGEEYLQSDQKILLFRVPQTAKKIYEQLGNDIKSYLDAFVTGINRFADEHRDSIRPELMQVLPVSVYDVIGHMIRITNLEFLAGEDIAVAYQEAQRGSNAIAIAPSKSESGNAMLIINPHLPWNDFFMFFEAHLNCEGFNCYGVSLVGMPAITMGFNQYLGWTLTINPIDASDRYRLKLKEGGYILDDSIINFESKEISIKVKQEDGSLQTITNHAEYSRHGPVVSRNRDEAYAVRIAGYDNSRLLEQYYKMAAARNFHEFESAVRMMQLPMFNIIYADRDGNIFYLFNGNIPVRTEGDFSFWKGTIDGTRSSLIWDSIHAYKDLPKLLNPPSGFLQNCNDPPWFCTDPPVLNPDNYPPYFSSLWTFLRPQHAVNMMKNNPSVSYEQLLDYKQNTEPEAADRFLDELLEAANEYPDPALKEAAEVLKKWDRKTETDSRGAILFTSWWNRINNQMFEERWNPDDPFNTPRGIKNKETAVELLIAAAEEVKKRYGKLDVAWGDVNRFRLNEYDFPANGGPGDYGIFRTIYFREDTDEKNRAIAGETFVAVVEFGENLKANVILSYGNSSQPGNRHCGDQLDMLSLKKLRSVLFQKENILKNIEKEVTLKISDE